MNQEEKKALELDFNSTLKIVDAVRTLREKADVKSINAFFSSYTNLFYSDKDSEQRQTAIFEVIKQANSLNTDLCNIYDLYEQYADQESESIISEVFNASDFEIMLSSLDDQGYISKRLLSPLDLLNSEDITVIEINDALIGLSKVQTSLISMYLSVDDARANIRGLDDALTTTSERAVIRRLDENPNA